MTFYVLIPWFLLMLVVFQHAVLGTVFFHSIAIEISLVLVIYAGLRMAVFKGCILSLLLGLMMDCITGVSSGFYALIYGSIFLLAHLVSLQVYAKSNLFVVLFTLCCGFVEGIWLLVLNQMLYGTNILSDLIWYFFPQLAIVSLISPFLFKFFYRIGWLHDGYVRSS
jgi:cell shape-determining protein MreD